MSISPVQIAPVQATQVPTAVAPLPLHISRATAAALCVAVPLVFGLYAVLLPQDANWDLQNYHWYNAYAFLTGRADQDIAPAHVPTFYNPTLDVPFYLAAQVLPARVLAFILGALQGLNFAVLYGIAMRAFTGVAVSQRRLSALGVALVGVLGGGNLGMIGTTFYDNIISLFVLSSIWVVIGTHSASLPRLAVAGLLAGIGVGLKLPTVVFAIGLCAACFALPGSFVQRFKSSFVFGLGVLLGFAVFAGHWTLHLWAAFQNPVFPYFNGLFQSDMGLSQSYRDTRFVPGTVSDILFFPILMALNAEQAGEIVFRDWRIAAAFVMLLLTPLAMLVGRTMPRDDAAPNKPAAKYICAAVAVSYAVWLGLFGIYRYLIPVEMLAPLLVVIAVMLWPGPARFKTNLVVAVLALLVVTGKPGTWGRVPYGDTFVSATPPEIAEPAQALVLLAGHAPVAWTIPFFPPEVSFVRIQGFINSPEDGDTGLNRKIRNRIESTPGAIYMLAPQQDRAFADTMLSYYGLALDVQNCRAVSGNLAPNIELCRVNRRTPE